MGVKIGFALFAKIVANDATFTGVNQSIMSKRGTRRRIPSPRFHLVDKSVPMATIMFAISVNRQRIRWATGEYVHTDEWNVQAGRAVVGHRVRDIRANRRLNDRLDSYARAGVQIANEHLEARNRELIAGNPAPVLDQAEYIQELKYRVGLDERPRAVSIFNEAGFVVFAESLRDYRHEDMKRGTWKVLNNHVNLLRKFADATHDGKVGFQQVDRLFVDAFKRYLFRIQGHRRSTVAKVLITLRQIASRAAERSLMPYGREFRAWTKLKTRKHRQVDLTAAEFQAFVDLDLSGTPRLERVRDLFLLGVATGQRWSDFSKLTPANFTALDGGYIFRVTSQAKTGRTATGWVDQFAVPILERYGYVGGGPFTPPKLTGQRFNDYLKEVAQRAIPGATFTVYHDGEDLDHVGTRIPKYALMASHVARRTAIARLRNANVPDAEIQRFTGHATLSELDRYDNRSDEALARRLRDHLENAPAPSDQSPGGHLRAV